MARNPFRPTAGATPPMLVGRADPIEEFVDSIGDGPGAPGRLMIFTGPRGVGKTVMLTEVRSRAAPLGWVSVAETATAGMTDRMTRAVARHTAELDRGSADRRSVTGFTLPAVGGGVSFAEPTPQPPHLREELTHLLDVLEPHGTGLLITVDEVHRTAIDEMRTLATTVQHLISEDREIAMTMAGLPSAVSDLLNDDVLTFLRRANREDLRDVALDDVRAAMAQTVADYGRTITDTALTAAAEATGGYPFMIQLVGYHCWRKAYGDVIDEAAVAEGIPAARKRLGSTVHQAALADLSPVDRTFLLAMAHDPGQSHLRDIAGRMGESVRYASVYRQRLIDASVIEPTDRGYVDFAIPYLREYLREHAARYEMTSRDDR